MNKKDTEYFKQKLLSEKARLEAELSGVGRKNPDNPNDWQVTTSDIDVDTADENELADKLEEYEGNSGILKRLEEQLIDVNTALTRTENGTYGLCEVCNKPIERDRLEANPAARTSIKHGHDAATKK